MNRHANVGAITGQDISVGAIGWPKNRSRRTHSFVYIVRITRRVATPVAIEYLRRCSRTWLPQCGRDGAFRNRRLAKKHLKKRGYRLGDQSP